MKYPNWIEKCLPTMTPQQQKKMLHQLVKEANEDSRKQAILDPLSRVPAALNEIRAVFSYRPLVACNIVRQGKSYDVGLLVSVQQRTFRDEHNRYVKPVNF